MENSQGGMMNVLPHLSTRRSLVGWALIGPVMNRLRGQFLMRPPNTHPDASARHRKTDFHTWVVATGSSVLQFSLIADSLKRRKRDTPLRILKGAGMLARSDWELALGGQPIFVRLRFTPKLAGALFGLGIAGDEVLLLSGFFHFGIEVESRGKKRVFQGPNGFFQNINTAEMAPGQGLLVRLDPASPPGRLTVARA